MCRYGTVFGSNSRLVLDWIDSVKSEPNSRVLLVCDDNSPLAKSLPKHLPVDVRIVTDDKNPPGFSPEGYDWILIHVERANILNLRSRLALAERHLGVEGKISIFIEHRNAELDHADFSSELAQNVAYMLPSDWMDYELEGRFVGGRLKRRLRQAERSLYRFVLPASPRRLPQILWGTGCWFLVAALTALNNLYNRSTSSYCPNYCSSAVLSLTRRNRVPRSESPSASYGHRTSVKHLFPGDEP